MESKDARLADQQLAVCERETVDSALRQGDFLDTEIAAVDELAIADEVMVASPDFGHLEPLLHAARSELEAVRVTQQPEDARAPRVHDARAGAMT